MWIVGIILVVVIVGFLISVYNNFVKDRNKIEEAVSTIEAYLKKRYDLIPNLVEVVKGYAKHENETFVQVIEARNKVMSAVGFDEMAQSENTLRSTLKSLFAVAENYPELKANENFMDLQEELSQIEDDILQARKYYNAIVRKFNTRVDTFPEAIVAKIFKFEKREYYRISEEEKQNVKIKF